MIPDKDLVTSPSTSLRKAPMNSSSPLMQWFQAHVPFVALFTEKVVKERPMLLRAIEALVIAVVGGAFSAYITLNVTQAVEGAQLKDLRDEVAQQHHDTIEQINSLEIQISNIRPQVGYQSRGSGS